MQTNITHYEDMMQLEDDILCFLPTLSDIDVFGCEVDLRLYYSATLASSFPHSTNATKEAADCSSALHSRGPLYLAFQEGDKENYPKAVRVPVNPRREIADCSTYAPACGNC